MQKIIWTTAFTMLAATALPAQSSDHSQATAAHEAGVKPRQTMSAPYEHLQWQAIIPELGADSPQVSILRVDPTTQATQLLIRVPKHMHVPVHWHSANETHTIIKGTWVFEHEGERHEFGPGGFNYLPALMHHEAWASNDALVFITVDAAWDVNWVSGPPSKSDLGQRPPTR